MFLSFQFDEMNGLLEKEPDNKKAREGFIEAARTLELTDIKELHGLAETMFKVWKSYSSKDTKILKARLSLQGIVWV